MELISQWLAIPFEPIVNAPLREAPWWESYVVYPHGLAGRDVK